ncbi:hypothetical protein BDZ89DRAFT_976420 [Hymenopellis radicata]|nr:hypothetical protein BDZ89DRAFT_976420 [Hymenopellis radicata]
MPPRAGQKRAATSNGDPEASSSSQAPSKKTRFVDPSEDPANFAEQVDSALETSNRKGRVKNEGYDSDSSDDGEGVVFSRKKNADGGDDDEDDMFAMGDKDDKEQDDGPKKKKTEYMRLGDIEGQEFTGNGSGEESSEDEPEDEDDAERRRKAGMGFELSSFNMREEMEEGKFTDDGSYVRSVDVHAQHDRWMEGVDERAIKAARRRKRQQEKEQRDKMLAEEQEIAESGGVHAMEKDLLQYLKKGETLLEALQRLGTRAKKLKQKHKAAGKSHAGDAMNIDKQHHALTDVERMTHIASNIMSLGDTDIYSKTYEELVRSVRSSGIVDANWEPPSADKKYEYKWDMPGAGQAGDVFGPFGEEEMDSWFKASYFGVTGEKVKVREVGGEWKDWNDVLP